MAKQYIFTEEIAKELLPFRCHLVKQGQDESTIIQKTNYVGLFLEWLEKERLQADDVTYNDMAAFIDTLKTDEKSTNHINRILQSVRNYYEFIQKENPTIKNPAINLKLRGTRQKIPGDIISFGTLEELYTRSPSAADRTKRNKCILGLFIYQGIKTEELHKLEPIHLDLKKGTIYVPAVKRSNSRVLDLKPCQILGLNGYVNEIRPKLITSPTNQLFVSMGGMTDLKSSLHHMFRAIKKKKPEINNAKQIRASAIVHWLKTNNLRQVQYMAGHKWVSSTEYYKMNYLEDLKRGLDMYHPLK